MHGQVLYDAMRQRLGGTADDAYFHQELQARLGPAHMRWVGVGAGGELGGAGAAVMCLESSVLAHTQAACVLHTRPHWSG